MKLSGASAHVVGLLLILAVPIRLRAQITPEMQESTIRIICPDPAEKGGKGFNIVPLELESGEVANYVEYSFGSGFVINNDGCIVTNNHVVAPDPLKETPNPLVMVMQKVGRRYILHKANVLWQSANIDLAVIQAPQLKAKPFPLVFDETKSTPSEEVYSMGFPGITDLAEEDFKRAEELRQKIIEIKAFHQVQALQKQLHRKLKSSQIRAVRKEVADNEEPPAADWMDLLAGLHAVLQRADPAAGAWDVSDVISSRTLWADYFKPTVTKGSIERIARIHGFLGLNHPDVLMFQHGCAIKHGNSGGPLLNAGGQVIAIVGSGVYTGKDADLEIIKWAAAAGELKNWLELHGVPYTLGGEWRVKPEPPQPQPQPQPEPIKIIQQLPATIIEKPTLKVVERLPRNMIVAISLAVAVTIVVAIFGIVKARAAPSVTQLLRDPRMAKALGSTPLELLADAPPSGSATWQLTGRTTKGDRVCLELTSMMFADNDYRLILGRTAELCHVVVDDDSISKQHAHIRQDGDRFFVADRNSANHTMLNGQINVKVFDEVPIKEGDTLALGQVRLDFSRA